MSGTGGIAERFAVPGVVPASPVGKAAPLLLEAKAAPLFELADAAASGEDADAVHDMRVASRRTREAMTLLEPYYPPKSFARFNDRIRAVTKALGRVRDSDVFAQEFAALASKAADGEERVALAWLVGVADGRRPALVRHMRKKLARLDMGRCGAKFARFARGVRDVPDARGPIGGCAGDAVDVRITALYGHLPAALDAANSQALHAMRIDAKRLRYAVETFAPAFEPDRLDELYPVLKGLQDELGELHDRDVFTEAVHAAEDEGSAQAAGVTDAGLEAVIADLAAERARRFTAFRRLLDDWPEHRMRRELLGALVTLPPVEGIPGLMKRLAAIDIGSNSIRMLVADVGKSGRYRLLTEERAQTRLATGMAMTGRLDEAASAATLDALTRMIDIAHNYKVDTVRAVATAAVRDASNGADFLAAVHEATGIEIEIVSVGEEARLAFLGATANFELSGRTVILDVGGGSSEIVRAVGGAIESDRSLPLGVVRLTEQFYKGDPLTDKAFRRMRRYVRRMLAAEFGETPPATPMVIGSGGSVTALAGMAARVEKWSYLTVHGAELTQAQVAQQLSMVRRMTQEQRRHIPGLPEHRADIIVAGALVVAEVMRLFSANILVVNAKGLREALVLDTIERANATPTPTADRMRGVMEFARRTRFEKEHALQVATLATSLFDQLAEPLGLEVADRQLLEAAAVLHDVGYFIGYEDHHKHSYHLITHAMLPGFSPRETLVIASTARYHRGALPARKHESMRRLTPEDRVRVERLAAILRLADGMDRSRIRLVRAVRARVSDDHVSVTLVADDPIDVEVYGAGQKGNLFERVFGLDLEVEAQVRGPLPTP